MKIDLWFATTNKGKLDEFKLMLEKALPEIKVHSLNEINHYYPPPETGKTFQENATIKARSLHAVKQNDWVVADDSGLEVTGLNHLPGIHSARYAGEKASDAENVAKLLKMMQIRSLADRSARFVCSMVAYGPNGEILTFNGILNGAISAKPSGKLGFGYDPVFVAEGQTQTLADLGTAFKNQHSHRAQATSQLIAALNNFLRNGLVKSEGLS